LGHDDSNTLAAFLQTVMSFRGHGLLPSPWIRHWLDQQASCCRVPAPCTQLQPAGNFGPVSSSRYSAYRLSSISRPIQVSMPAGTPGSGTKVGARLSGAL